MFDHHFIHVTHFETINKQEYMNEVNNSCYRLVPGLCHHTGACDGDNYDPPKCVNCTKGWMGGKCEIPCTHGEQVRCRRCNQAKLDSSLDCFHQSPNGLIDLV